MLLLFSSGGNINLIKPKFVHFSASTFLAPCLHQFSVVVQILHFCAI